MVDTKWCNNNLNSGPITFREVKLEVIEFIEARNLRDKFEEFGDVLYFTYCWLYSRYGINLPMIGAMGSVEKFIKRLDVWKCIFRESGLKFDTKYLVNGSNYERPEKREKALYLAWREQRGGNHDV